MWKTAGWIFLGVVLGGAAVVALVRFNAAARGAVIDESDEG